MGSLWVHIFLKSTLQTGASLRAPVTRIGGQTQSRLRETEVEMGRLPARVGNVCLCLMEQKRDSARSLLCPAISPPPGGYLIPNCLWLLEQSTARQNLDVAVGSGMFVSALPLGLGCSNETPLQPQRKSQCLLATVVQRIHEEAQKTFRSRDQWFTSGLIGTVRHLNVHTPAPD
ncbi:UNVERIFIED_CONTAM: hypothetical protein K2H54_010818 [Gekko kuhli]